MRRLAWVSPQEGSRPQAEKDPRTAIALALVLLISAFLYVWNIDFPLGFHADEPPKVHYVQTSTQDFTHPLLLLQAVRVINGVFGFDQPYQVALLGRTLTAIYGILAVAFFYLLVRPLLSSPYRILATLALATSPILVVHAHYFKEDVLLTALCLLTLFSLFRFVNEPSRSAVMFLGLSTGLAISAHYKALLLFVLFAIVPTVIGHRRATFAKQLPFIFLIALTTFLAINYPLIRQFATFKQGILTDFEQLTNGHYLRIDPVAHWFGFHLMNSVVPGVTSLMTLVALSSLAYLVIRRQLTWQDKILLQFLVLFHMAIEISPSKPPPDFMRYVLPEVPIFIYFAFKGLQALREAASSRWTTALANSLIAAVILLPLQSAVRLDYHLARDTRDLARKFVSEQANPAIFERYAAVQPDVLSVAEIDLESARRRGTAFLVASSFQYERFLYGGTLANQDPGIYRLSCAYQKLFNYPYVEFTPAYRSFAFSNPTIRVIDIRAPKDTATGPSCGGHS